MWAPELRLYCLWLPILVLPIGLGISGVALEHHYHYMVLALGIFLVAFAALLAVPIFVDYAVECFIDYATECTIIITIWHGSNFHLGCRHHSTHSSVERFRYEKTPPAAEFGLHGSEDSSRIDL